MKKWRALAPFTMNFFLKKKNSQSIVCQLVCVSALLTDLYSYCVSWRGPKKITHHRSHMGSPLSLSSRVLALVLFATDLLSGPSRPSICGERSAQSTSARVQEPPRLQTALRARSDPRTVLVLCRWRSSSLQTQHAHHRDEKRPSPRSPVQWPVLEAVVNFPKSFLINWMVCPPTEKTVAQTCEQTTQHRRKPASKLRWQPSSNRCAQTRS